MAKKTVAQVLAAARQECGYPVRVLAPLVRKENGGRIVPSYITDLEKGRGVPSDFVALELAKALDLDPDDFLSLVRAERTQRRK